MIRGYTTFGVGTSAEAAYAATKERSADDALAAPVAGTTYIYEIQVPSGSDGSKIATLIQKAARDEAVVEGLDGDVAPAVAEGAALIENREVCLAIRMEGRLGERMKQRLGHDEGDAYLLFGLLPEE